MRKLLIVALVGKIHKDSIAKLGGCHEKAIGPLLVVCLVAWVVGITTPLMTVQKLVLMSDSYSLLDFTQKLYRDGEWLLVGLVVVFGLITPYLKLDLQYRIWSRYAVGSAQMDKAFQRVELISKWTMMDVFAVAIILVIFKTSGILADARVEPGLYFFVGASLGSMVLSLMLSHAVKGLSLKVECKGEKCR